MKDVVTKLYELINEVRNSNEFRELPHDDRIEACLAPKYEEKLVDHWAVERNITALPVEGPSIPLYETVRTKNIIRKEQAQLPEDRPGIVIITADWNLLFFTYGYEVILSELEEVMREYPKLVAVVLSHSYQGGIEDEYIAREGQHMVVKRTTNEELIEETIFSFNGSSKFRVSTSVIKKIQGAFIAG